MKDWIGVGMILRTPIETAKNGMQYPPFERFTRKKIENKYLNGA
ncbi:MULTISPECIES: hypothetical protein [Cupriavidus]